MRLTASRRSKYGAVKVEVDGVVFDSKREAAHYQELRLRQYIGEIGLLELQPVFLLAVNGVVIGKYIADFQYVLTHNGEVAVDDVKGFDVPLGRWKRKHAAAQYGIQIRVVK